MAKAINQIDQNVERAMDSRKFIAGGKKALVFIDGRFVEFENPGTYDNLRSLVRARLTRTTTA